MFNSAILEVVVGVIFIYMLLSLLATTINELIMTLLTSARGRILERAIMAMLDDHSPPVGTNPKQGDSGNVPGTKLAKDFYQHPFIVKLSEQGRDDRPSYISKAYFSKIVMDLLGAREEADTSFAAIAAAVEKLPEGKTKQLLLALVNDTTQQVTESRAQLAMLKAKLENWYDEMMDRALGWYKRRVQRTLLVIGFVMGVFFNADTFNIVHHLFNDPKARAVLVAQAEQYRNEVAKETSAKMASINAAMLVEAARNKHITAADTSQASLGLISKLNALKLLKFAQTSEDSAAILKVDSLNKQINSLVSEEFAEASTTAGMGWNVEAIKNLTWKADFATVTSSLGQFLFYCLGRLPGWCVTALAVTLGAPFWFDILNKVVNIRNVGKKPEEKPKQG